MAFVNLVFNYILIYGKFGVPALGVRGAAIATVISRCVEAAVVLIHIHRHREQNPFIVGLYATFRVPGSLVFKIVTKGMPLLLNETLWAAGMATLTQCYSIRGLNVIAALNISNTIGNIFNIVFIALGESVAIIVGQLLGAGYILYYTHRHLYASARLSALRLLYLAFRWKDNRHLPL